MRSRLGNPEWMLLPVGLRAGLHCADRTAVTHARCAAVAINRCAIHGDRIGARRGTSGCAEQRRTNAAWTPCRRMVQAVPATAHSMYAASAASCLMSHTLSAPNSRIELDSHRSCPSPRSRGTQLFWGKGLRVQSTGRVFSQINLTNLPVRGLQAGQVRSGTSLVRGYVARAFGHHDGDLS